MCIGIGLGIIAGWVGAYDLKWGIGIAIGGYIALAALGIAEASTWQDQIDPVAFVVSLAAVGVSGLITWKVRTHFLKKRDDL